MASTKSVQVLLAVFVLSMTARPQSICVDKQVRLDCVRSVANLFSNDARGVSTSVDIISEQGSIWKAEKHEYASVAHALTRMNVVFDTATALKVPAGTLHFTLGSYAGRIFPGEPDSPQPSSSMDGLRGTRALAWWWEQSYYGGRIKVRAGRMDANEVFAGNDVASSAMNGAFGYSPTIALMPSYPDTQLGVTAISELGRQEYAVGTFHASGGGAVVFAQVSRKWEKSGDEGQASVGIWRGYNQPDRS